MKKVLFIASQPFFQWRGSPIRVGFDVTALAESGYSVDLLVLPVGEKREIAGVRVLRAPNLLCVKDVPIGPSISKALFDLIMLFQGIGLGLRNHYDVIHCVEDAGPVGVIIAGMTGAKLVFEKHSDPSSYKKGFLRNLIMGLYGRVERFTMRHADACIGTGPGLVEQIKMAAPGKPAHHIFDIPSSLVEADNLKTAEIRARFKRNDGDVLVCYVGSFAVYQGVDLMFEAMPAAVKKNPHVRFVIIGGSEAEIAARRAYLAGQGVGQAVEFVGKVPPDELPSYLAAADVLMSPRLAGLNTPLKLLDYLKAGSAIVATDTSANRLILDERISVLTKATPEDFAAGICKLAADPVLRKMIGGNGRKLIDRVYNYGEFKRLIAQCYSDIVAS